MSHIYSFTCIQIEWMVYVEIKREECEKLEPRIYVWIWKALRRMKSD